MLVCATGTSNTTRAQLWCSIISDLFRLFHEAHQFADVLAGKKRAKEEAIGGFNFNYIHRTGTISQSRLLHLSGTKLGDKLESINSAMKNPHLIPSISTKQLEVLFLLLLPLRPLLRGHSKCNSSGTHPQLLAPYPHVSLFDYVVEVGSHGAGKRVAPGPGF